MWRHHTTLLHILKAQTKRANKKLSYSRMQIYGLAQFFAIFQYLFTVFGQQCPGGPAKIIQGSTLQHHDLQTCDDVRDYSHYLTSFLDNCTFASHDATGKGACQYECLYGVDCYALTYTAAGGCKICRPSTSEAGNGNDVPLADIFVAGWKLKEYINGQFQFHLKLRTWG